MSASTGSSSPARRSAPPRSPCRCPRPLAQTRCRRSSRARAGAGRDVRLAAAVGGGPQRRLAGAGAAGGAGRLQGHRLGVRAGEDGRRRRHAGRCSPSSASSRRSRNLPMQNPLGGEDAAFEAQLPKLAEDAAFCQAIGCRRFQLVLPGDDRRTASRRTSAGRVVQRPASRRSAASWPSTTCASASSSSAR